MSGYQVSGAPGTGMDWSPREVPIGSVTPAGLLLLIRLDAMRAGIDAEELPGGRVRLEAAELEPADACTVLGNLLGTSANRHVLHAGGFRVIR